MLPILAAAILCMGAVLADLLQAVARYDRVLQQSRGDPHRLSGLILEAVEFTPTACPGQAATAAGELDRLMWAITVTERFAKSRSERLLEDLAIRVTAALGLPIPDLSLGDGQIRVSTAEKVAEAIKGVGPANDRGRLALALLDPCTNHKIGVLILSAIASERGLTVANLDHASIIALASAYNGQSIQHSPAAALANATYDNVVYDLFYELAFHGKLTGPPISP